STQAPTPAPPTHVGHLADSVKATGMSIARFSSTLVASRCGGCRGRSTADVAARGGAGGVDATRSLQRSSEVEHPDGAQPPRSSARVPRGRATPPAPPCAATSRRRHKVDLHACAPYAARVTACLCKLDSGVEYEGPRARFATLGGSPTWGLGDRFHEIAATHGHARLGTHRPRTPYGPGPSVEHYRAPSGREFLRIPSYGQVIDEDPELRASEWKTFWILWKAGVRVLLVGGTSGSCDWRRSAADEDAVRPGDLV